MANYTLQLKRNEAAYSSKSIALTNLKNALGGSNAAKGEPMIAIYTENGVEKVILGIVSSNGKYTIFEGGVIGSDGNITVPESIQDAIESECWLVYEAFSTPMTPAKVIEAFNEANAEADESTSQDPQP